MLADRLAQHRERRPRRSQRTPQIDLLQGDNVGMVALDGLEDAAEIEAAIGADAAMDVPGHDADDAAGTWVQRCVSASAG